MTLLKQARQLEKTRVKAAVCVVVASTGSTPRKIGAKMIVIDDGKGRVLGTIGGGAIEHFIQKKALEAIRLKKPELVTTSLRNELGMCCGGEMMVFIEPIEHKPQFICFGAGHIAQALCPLVMSLGFNCLVIDERAELLSLEAFAFCEKLDDCSSFAINALSLDESFVVVATHDHNLDQKIIENILPKPFTYGALVGSKRKALMTHKRLLAKGFLSDDINRIYCPAGLEIYAQTPQEIALSIAAQITVIKNGQKPCIKMGEEALNDAPMLTSTPSFLSTISKAPNSPMRSISST